MKKNILFIFLSVLVLSGCTKFDGTFKDGYTDGQDKATAKGVSSDSLGNNFSKLQEAAVFPGLVPASEPRGSFDVTLDLSVKYVQPGDIRVITTPALWVSTGLYAAPGEVFTINVPTGVNGLSARVGAWTDYLRVDVLKRDPGVSTEVQLVPGKNYVRSLYGGAIYINNYSRIETLGMQTLGFHNVVRSPDFILGISGNEEWNVRVRQSVTPWFQLRGKRIVFELPKRFLDKYPIADPTQLMQEWDRIIESDIYFWKGLEEFTSDSLNKIPEAPLRLVMDIQLVNNNYAHAGFPIMITMNENEFLKITNINTLKTKGAWQLMEAIGSNYLTHYWIPSYLQTPGTNLYNAKMANRLNINLGNMHDSMKLAIDSGLFYVKRNLAAYINNMNSNANFARDIVGFKNSNLIRLLPFMQIFENFGYDLYTKMDRESRYFTSTMNNNQKIDYIYTTISHERQIDFIPFFEMWGLPVSPVVAARIKELYPRLSLDIYNYNPLLPGPMHGMTGSVPPPNRDINRLNWGIVEYCCEELQAGYHTTLFCKDYDVNTYWRTQWFATQSLPSHSPHYLVIDMNSYHTMGGFWYQNPAMGDDGKFTPKALSFYIDTANAVNHTEYEWKRVVNITAGPNNNEIKNVYNFTPSVRGRYLKVEIFNSNVADPLNQNSVSVAEIGVLTPPQ